MKEEIEKLLAEKKVLLERVKNIESAIEAFQKVCTHKMICEGHDSHKNYYKCTICGHEDWV